MKHSGLIIELKADGNGAATSKQNRFGRRHSRELELRSAAGDRLPITFEWQGDAPEWLAPTINAMTVLLRMSANWNSYGARPIDVSAVARTLELLAGIMRIDSPAPAVAPTPKGGIQLEWHLRGIDLEVEPLPEGRVYVLFEDLRSGDEWEQELSADLTPLVESLGELSRRK
jgi:hypothetical protein